MKLDSSFGKFDYKWTDSKNVTVSESDTLLIPINDMSVLGEYNCICKSKTSYKTYQTSTIIDSMILNKYSFVTRIRLAKEAPKINIAEYKVTIVSTPTQFRFGEKFSLECQITPNIEKMTIQWTKDNELLGVGKVLTLERFGKNDTGIYVCKATRVDQKNVTVKMEAHSQQAVCNFQHYNIGT